VGLGGLEEVGGGLGEVECAVETVCVNYALAWGERWVGCG